MRTCLVILICFLIPVSALGGPDKDAKTAFEQQDFEKAARILVEKLMKKDDHQDNISLMEQSLQNAFKKGISQAKDLEAKGDVDGAVQIYRRLKDLGEKVSFLQVRKETEVDGKKKKEAYSFEVPDVSSNLSALENQAVAEHYQTGVKQQEANSWKEAAIAFRKTMSYNKSYEDAAQRYELCRKNATLRIAVMPFENLTGKNEFGAVHLQLTEQIVSNALSAQPEFLQFVTRDYLNQLLAEQGMQQSEIMDPSSATEIGKKLGVHAFVFGKVLSIVTIPPSDQVEHGESRATLYVDKGQVPVYAEWWKHTLQGSVTINASYQIVGVETGAILAAEQETGSATHIRRWLTYKGDEEALEKSVKAHQIEGEGPVDVPEVLAQKALASLAGALASKLTAYFQ